MNDHLIEQIALQLVETRHLIEIRDDGWTIAHPLIERVHLDLLFDCPARWIWPDPGKRGRFWLTEDYKLGTRYDG